MKKLFLAGAVALMGAVTVNAQTSKGNWVVSGNTAFNFSNSNVKYEGNGLSQDGPKTTQFSIAAGVGYFAIDNLAIGLDAVYQSTKVKFDSAENTQSTTVVMPTASYYFSEKSLRPYLGVGAGIGSIKQSDSSESGFAWGAKGGLVYLLNNKVGLNLGLSYTSMHFKLDNKVDMTSGGIGVTAGINVFLGK